MSKIAGKARTHEQWLEQLWHVHCGLLDIASLTAQRAIERRELTALELLAGRIGGVEKAMHIQESAVRYLVDTGDISGAEQRAEELIAQAEKSGNRAFLRKAYSWRAVIFRELSHYTQAIEAFRIAESFSDNELQLMELWLDKGMTLSYANRFEEAETMLKRAIEVGAKYNDVSSQGTAWNNLGICYGQQKLWDQASDAYHRALECYRRTGYKLGSAMVSGNAAEVYISLGLLDKALVSVQNCIQLGTEAEDSISIGLGHDLQGRLLEELGEYKEAIASMEKGLEIYQEVGDDYAWVICQLKLVPLLAKTGMKEKATQYYWEMEERAKGIPSEKLQRDVKMIKAWVLFWAGEMLQSKDLLEKTVPQTVEGSYERREYMNFLSRVYLALGDQAKAKAAYQEALNAFSPNTTILQKVEIYHCGMRLYEQCGLPQEAIKCRDTGRAQLECIRSAIKDLSVWERYRRKQAPAELLAAGI